MDPVANMTEQRTLARSILDDADKFGESDELNQTDEAQRLAELVLALHEWRTNGGFDPYNA